MNTEELQSKVTEKVREQIVKNLNAPVNESIALISAGVIGVLALAGGFAAVIAAIKRSKIVQPFLEEHLPNYERELEVLVRKFKYARTMKDVEDIERSVDKHLDKLNRAYEASFKIKANQVDGQKYLNMLRRMNTRAAQNELQTYISLLEAAFRAKINHLRDEVDSRFDGMGSPA